MATRTDIRDFIAMVTGGFMPLRDLIVKGQEMGLNVQDTVEIVANLQPNLVPSNIMASMNAPAMVGDPYTAPRIGFDEAVTEYGVQEEPPTSIFQEQKKYFGPDFDYQDVDTDEMMPDPITYTSGGYGYSSPRNSRPLTSPATIPMGEDGYVSPPTSKTGSGSMSMSDIINTNLQASQAEVGSMTQPGLDQPVIDIEPQVPPRPPTPVNFSYGDTQTGMMDAAATLRSPFTSDMDRQAAQDYMSGIVSNIRLPF